MNERKIQKKVQKKIRFPLKIIKETFFTIRNNPFPI